MYIHTYQRVGPKFWRSLKLIDVEQKKSYPLCFNQYDKLTVFQGAKILCWNLRRWAVRWDRWDFVFQQIVPSLWQFQAFYVTLVSSPPPNIKGKGVWLQFLFLNQVIQVATFSSSSWRSFNLWRVTFSPFQKDHNDLPGRHFLRISYLDLKAWNIFGWGKTFFSDSYFLILQDVSPFAMCI